jgi:hypothetical protein
MIDRSKDGQKVASGPSAGELDLRLTTSPRKIIHDIMIGVK